MKYKFFKISLLAILILISGFYLNFDTAHSASLPVVDLSGISDSGNVVTLNGNVTSEGGSSITERGFVYNTTGNPKITNSRAPATGTTGPFTSVVNVPPGKTYYFKAYATNSDGTSYGTIEESFTAPSLPSIAPLGMSYSDSSHIVTFNGNVTSEGGSPIIERGVIYNATGNPKIPNSRTPATGTTGPFTSTVSVPPGKTYYFKAYATNSNGTSYSANEESFTAPAPLAVATVDVQATSKNTATGTGKITSGVATVSGLVWSTTVNPITANNKTTDGWAEGGPWTSDFSKGLLPGTLYHVRAYATNSVGTVYGEDRIFTTLALPTVTTADVTTVTKNSAVGGGNVAPDGGAPITARGLVYSSAHNPTIANQTTTETGTTGSFTSDINIGLSSGTTYYVRAYATNSVGTTYGAEKSFTTFGITTSPVTNITDNSVTGGGEITSDGGSAVTERGVAYSSAHLPTIANRVVKSGTGTGSFTGDITVGLLPDTTYYVRAYAKNGAGTMYGSEVAFTTEKAPTPDLTAGAITPITATVGTSMMFTSKISNIGAATTGGSFPNFFQVATATEGGGTVSQIGVGSTLGKLAPGANANVLSSSHVFSATGVYSVRACADKRSAADGGIISESNEENNCGPWKDVTVNPAPLTAPAKPTGLTVTPASCGGLNIFWNASVSAESYTLLARKISVGGSSFATIYTGTETSFSHTDLIAGVTYSYIVYATNSVGSSSYSSSDAVSKIAPVACTTPAVNGSCGTAHYVCTSGTSINNNPDFTNPLTGLPSYSWTCQGSSGGSDKVCWETKSGITPLNGACGASHYLCSVGISTNNNPDGMDIFTGKPAYTWTCQGSNSGSSAACSEPKSSTSPDLTPGIVTLASFTVNTATTLSSTISNTGTASTGIGFSNFFQIATAPNGGGTITDLGATSMGALSAGASNVSTRSHTFTSVGQYSLRICADKTSSAGGGVITESDEGNNCGTWTNVNIVNVPPTTYTLTINKTGSGIVIGAGTYSPGTTVTISAIPSSGFTFTGWDGTDCMDGSVTMNANKICIATFIAVGNNNCDPDGGGGGNGGDSPSCPSIEENGTCYSFQNSCGLVNKGIIQNGICTATVPSNAFCLGGDSCVVAGAGVCGPRNSNESYGFDHTNGCSVGVQNPNPATNGFRSWTWTCGLTQCYELKKIPGWGEN